MKAKSALLMLLGVVTGAALACLVAVGTRTNWRLVQRLQVAPAPVQSPVAARTDLSGVTLGVNFSDWQNLFGSNDSEKALRHLQGLPVTRVMFTPTWYQEACDSTEIRRLKGRTPDDKALARDLRKAKEMGFVTGIKFHIDPEDGSARSRIGFTDMRDFEAWFANYSAIAMRYARLANECGATHFSVGCELSNVTRLEHTERWRELIREVRKALERGGNEPAITYAARHQNVLNIGFLGDLDYIGINTWPYFYEYATLNLSNVRRSWRRTVYFPETFSTNSPNGNEKGYPLDFFDFLCLLGNQYGKPIMLTELGCQSKEGALTRPVDWWISAPADALSQVYFFAGFLAELRADIGKFEQEHPGRSYPLAGVDIWNYMIKEAGPSDSDYTFRNKSTELVFERFFSVPER